MTQIIKIMEKEIQTAVINMVYMSKKVENSMSEQVRRKGQGTAYGQYWLVSGGAWGPAMLLRGCCHCL